MTDDETVVLDASALVLLLVSGHATADALAARLRRSRFAAPAHLPVEADRVLRGWECGRKHTPAEAGAARTLSAAFPIDLWDWSLLADRAWELRANLTTYDAGSVALAERLGAPLITADVRIAGAPGVRCEIEVVRS